jgi:hypothetical protein
MKILLVSMPTLHFFRWTEQLKSSGHELYWFDILDGGQKVEKLQNVTQIKGWKRRFKYPGYYSIKRSKVTQSSSENKHQHYRSSFRKTSSRYSTRSGA